MGGKVKVEVAVDYQSSGPGRLQYVRTYRSDRGMWEDNFSLRATDMNKVPVVVAPTLPVAAVQPSSGCYWATGYYTGTYRCFAVPSTGNANDMALSRPGRPAVRFGGATSFAPAAHVSDRWTPIYDSNGKKIANQIQNAANNSTEQYSLDGFIKSVKYSDGVVHSYHYEPFPAGVQHEVPLKVLKRVTDSFGQSISFTHNARGKVETMTTPNNKQYTYAYDEPSGGTQVMSLYTSHPSPSRSARSVSAAANT